MEYSEFLKRNPEANKYLLTTAERGFVNLPSVTVALNLVLFGSTNEKYLTAFKREPSFPSCRGRFEFVRVPYLRNYLAENAIRKARDEQDDSEIGRLMTLLKDPYDDNPEFDHYAAEPPDWAQGISVSCSS